MTDYIRKMEDLDIPGLIAMMKKEWYGDFDVSEEYKAMGAYRVLMRYIKKCTSAYVFEKDDEILGYLLGRIEGEPLYFSINMDEFFDYDGPMNEIMKPEYEMDEIMSERCNNLGFDTELLMFMVNNERRGLGIGSNLLKTFILEAVSTGNKKMFFYTDDYCNTGYYEHIGCEDLGKEEAFYDGTNHIFYLFGLDLQKYVKERC